MVVIIMSGNYNDMGLPSSRNNPVEKASPGMFVFRGPDAPHIPWVVKIIRQERDEHGAVCPDYVHSSTGFLVSDMWLLTARHAVEQGGRPVRPEDVSVRGFYRTQEPGTPVSQVMLQIDAIEFSPNGGDIAALRLTAPYRLNDYAPVNLLHSAQGMIGIRVRLYAYADANNYRLGTAFGTVSRVYPDPQYPPTQQLLVHYDVGQGSGVSEAGDSGGPVLLGYPIDIGPRSYEMVVGLHVGGEPLQAEGDFVLLSDHRDFIEPLLMPQLIASISESNYQLVTALHLLNNCSYFERLAREPFSREAVLSDDAGTVPTSCNAFDSYRFFYKKASEGDSWDNATAYEVTPSGQTHRYELPLDKTHPHSDRELWDITVLPVGDGKVFGAGENGKPLPGVQSNFFVRTTPTVSLPTHLTISEQPGMPGMVKVSWKNSESPISGTIKGYTLFYMPADHVPFYWAGCEGTSVAPTSYETTSVVIPVYTSGNYALLVLPAVGDGVVGTQEDGTPYPGTYSGDQVTLIGPPVVRYQIPKGGENMHIDLNSHGYGIMANVSFDDQNDYEWVWCKDKPDGNYSSGGDWSFTSGKKSSILIFGSPEKPARSADSGWYKLKVENAFGVVETKPVFVRIEPPPM
ncbi:trypsin-like serine peptidase [Xenorhabdus bovienii]|nr:serine protease [Xenorhabdus bovienii]